MNINLDYANKKILEAHKIVSTYIKKTEEKRLDWLSKATWVDVYWKFENDQITWSFKIRGAYYRLKKLQNTWKKVIVASAWNHWLAIAKVAKELNIEAIICIPNNASQIKKEKLSYFNHSILQYWESLEETIKYAKKIAMGKGYEFISPFNDIDIIYWQWTLAKDFFDKIQPDTIIIPVWGWGLISWMAMYIRKNYPKTKIIGVEPENYNSLQSSLSNNKQVRVVNCPTFADWLSVNLEDNSVTLDIIKEFVDEVITASEEEIAAATLALLYHESKLVEPSWAISIAPILSWKIDKNYGKVWVVLSWWNVSVANITKIINFPFKDINVAKFTNFVYPKVEDEILIKWINNDTDSKIITEINNDFEFDVEYINNRFQDIRNRLQKASFRFKEYEDYCTIKNLNKDENSLFFIKKLYEIQKERISKIDLQYLRKALSTKNINTYNKFITNYLQLYRSSLHITMIMQVLLDYRSASYDQSLDTMFFSLESQDSPNVNYNRYESSNLTELENQLSEILSVNNEENFLFVTSSWMSSFNLIENYLSKYVLKTWDKILLPHYIYFETEEQVTKMSWVDVLKFSIYDTEGIIKKIKEVNPRVVFLDPMTNNLELHMIDVEEIIKAISNEKTIWEISVVIDWTMVSGWINPFEFDYNKDKIEILYYESCSKYLQLWLDISMWWLVVANIDNKNIFNRLRRNIGWIMYDFNVHSFPSFKKEEHFSRMKRFTRNALLVTEKLKSIPLLKDNLEVIFPLDNDHKDNKIAQKYDFIWWIVTFKFNNEYLNQRESLNSCIVRIIEVAKDKKISITKWLSFGFSLPRISAAAAMNELDPPFLRLSVWDRSEKEIEVVIEAIAEWLKNHIIVNENILE